MSQSRNRSRPVARSNIAISDGERLRTFRRGHTVPPAGAAAAATVDAITPLARDRRARLTRALETTFGLIAIDCGIFGHSPDLRLIDTPRMRLNLMPEVQLS